MFEYYIKKGKINSQQDITTNNQSQIFVKTVGESPKRNVSKSSQILKNSLEGNRHMANTFYEFSRSSAMKRWFFIFDVMFLDRLSQYWLFLLHSNLFPIWLRWIPEEGIHLSGHVRSRKVVLFMEQDNSYTNKLKFMISSLVKGMSRLKGMPPWIILLYLKFQLKI